MMVNSLSCPANPKAEHPSPKTSAVGVESVAGHGIFQLPTDINMASISTGVNGIPGSECDELEDCKPTAVKLEVLEELFGGGWDDSATQLGGGSLISAVAAAAASIASSSSTSNSRLVSTMSESNASTGCLDSVMPQLPLLTCHDFRIGGPIPSDVSSTLSPPTLTPRPPQSVLNAANAISHCNVGRLLKMDPSLEESRMPNLTGITDTASCFSSPLVPLSSHNLPPKLSLGTLSSISGATINSNTHVSTLSSSSTTNAGARMGLQRQQHSLSAGLHVIIPPSPLHPDTTTLSICSPVSIAGSSISGISNANSAPTNISNTSAHPLSPSSAMLSPTALADASSSSSVNKKTVFTAKGKGKDLFKILSMQLQ